jgi:Fe2+ or Zn2+ uptake regulation protein
MSHSKGATSGDFMQLLADICRQAGLKLTRPRLEVLHEIAYSGDRATLDKIDRRVRARSPAISRNAIRRILRELERVGIVRETDCPDEVARSRAAASCRTASSERKRAPRRLVSSKRR